MKNLTVEYLKKINACKDAIIKFKNTKELHGINISNVDSIIVKDDSLYYNIRWLILKKLFKLKKLTHKESNGYWLEYTYNENGNQLSYKNSKGDWLEYTYDENGNKLAYKESKGDWWEKTYDKNSNQLTFKNSNGNSWKYDEREIKITSDYHTAKYDLTDFEVKYK